MKASRGVVPAQLLDRLHGLGRSGPRTSAPRIGCLASRGPEGRKCVWRKGLRGQSTSRAQRAQRKHTRREHAVIPLQDMQGLEFGPQSVVSYREEAAPELVEHGHRIRGV